MLRALGAGLLLTAWVIAPRAGAIGLAAPACSSAETWTQTGADTFRLPEGLLRSQGVTTDGTSWIFSWQGGLEKTSDDYLPLAEGTLPPDDFNEAQINPDGSNYIGDVHIGDVDYANGHIYVPLEDPSEGPLNNPEYMHAHVALYDAKTLLYTGVKYAIPADISVAGVPWVAVNKRDAVVYTAEWDMPHDRLNVFDLNMHFLRFLPLRYAEALGSGFHLSRIQGAKMLGRYLYATRDDDQKSVFKIDTRNGSVTKVFSINPTGVSELEGLAVRQTPDGALLHVLLVQDNDTSNPQALANVRVTFLHYKREPMCDD